MKIFAGSIDWNDAHFDYKHVITYKNPLCPNYVHLILGKWPQLIKLRQEICKKLSFDCPPEGRYLDPITKEFRIAIAVAYSQPFSK